MKLKHLAGMFLALTIPALAVAQLEGVRRDFKAGEPITAAAINTNFGNVVDAMAAFEARLADLEANSVRAINSNLTLNVPADFATPHEALASLADKRINPTVTVTISISGTLSGLGPLEIEHPDARRVLIVGQGSATTVLRFTGHGIVAAGPQPWGKLDGLTLEGSGKDVSTGAGVWLGNGSGAAAGPDVVTRGFDYGFLATSSSSFSVSGTTAENNDVGYASAGASTLGAKEARSVGNNVGFLAFDGGYLRATEGATVVGPSTTGFLAKTGSNIRVGGALIEGEIDVTYDPAVGVLSSGGAYIMQ